MSISWEIPRLRFFYTPCMYNADLYLIYQLLFGQTWFVLAEKIEYKVSVVQDLD
jgi:hypothetical protein